MKTRGRSVLSREIQGARRLGASLLDQSWLASWMLGASLCALLSAFACGGPGISPDGGSGGTPATDMGTGGGPIATGGSAGSGGAPGSGGEIAGSGGAASEDPHSWNGCEDFQLPPDCVIPEGAVLPGELRCTGLYSNWEARTLRCGVRPFEPTHELWADGAGKQRYVWIPPGTTVDVSDPDEFDYPVGTRFWKEFYVGPEGSQVLGETRFFYRADVGWLYTAYVWNQEGTAAVQENGGVDDLFGTGHSVPSREQCRTCHIGRLNFIMGWDFFLLGDGATGTTLRDLADEGFLSGLDPAWLDVTIPGDEVEQAALAYMHVNCGVSCHNETLDATANPSGLFLRLQVDGVASVQETGAVGGINLPPSPNAMYTDLPDQPTEPYYDIRPLDPERSLLLARMRFRGSETAMPPLGSHIAHQEGVDAVTAWIEAMTTERGYPAPAE